MSVIARFSFVVVILSLVACDPAYPLFLRNGLMMPVTVQATFEGGHLSEGVLQPAEQLTFLHTKGEVQHVVVLHDGRKLHDLDKEALLTLLKSVPNPRRVIWNIRADGIEPLNRADGTMAGANSE